MNKKSEKNWVNESIFYHIYPLGFTGAPRYNEGEKTAGNRILDVLEWIPHLKEIGVNAVYFGPVFESVSHGYDTSDYCLTDSRLGTNEDLKRVIAELHENEIRVVLDGVFNHVGRGFFAFLDLQKNLEHSEYKDWFCNLNFSWSSPLGDPFAYETWHGAAELVKLNLQNPAVCEYLLNAVGMWMDEFGIDGLRLDAADCVDKEFFKKLRSFTKEKREDFWLMGEIIHGDYRMWANDEMLDSVTNYECWKGIYSSHNDKNYFEIAHSLKRQFGQGGLYEGMSLYNFLDNHDVNRIGSLLRKKENIRNAYTLLYFMPGIPSIYYGSEWGIEGEKGQGMDADLPLRPKLDLKEMEGTAQELITHLKKLAEIRSGSEAVKYGGYEDVLVRNEQLAFARILEGEYKIITLNLADHEETLQFRFRDKDYEVRLEAYSSQILE
ncbi:MAG: alpha-amylase [Lachnospiraceae bacterium]|nr:alpha-amylase [Lachnospiraceae bacterium]